MLRAGFLLFVLAFLAAPLSGLASGGGGWMALSRQDWDSIATSLLGGAAAMAVIILVGTPLAFYLARARGRLAVLAEAVVLMPMLMPTLALGILLAVVYGPAAPLGRAFSALGVTLTNTPAAFLLATIYAALPTYVIAARGALAQVPVEYEELARTLGDTPRAARLRVTLPLARRGLSAALSLAWVRALGEFGIILIVAYYPAGMPVQLWTDVQDLGLQAVFPLVAVFLLVTLPVPLWLGLRARMA
ncbi:molybdate ABC transporter permease subunit [Acidocella sp.]|uniref:molybdate ABC transporter permease subunit n=1 Tax=Acidocella sp. TaxID=50710 RepID=UPI003D02C09D